jgi:uncharacterized membrane protein
MSFLLVVLNVIHVIAATAAVGTNATSVFWLRAGGRDPDRIAFAVRGIRRLDRKLAIPAFGALFLTGLLMVALGMYDFTRGWILLAIALYLGLAVTGVRLMGPALRRLLAEAERNPNSEAFAAAEQTSMRYTLGSLAVLLVIVTLMVAKPF